MPNVIATAGFQTLSVIDASGFHALNGYETLNWIIRLAIAALCGIFIGWERKNRSKEAGIRTHTIVCMGTALMMIISKYGFSDMGVRASDYGRIAAQVISGIGFLGAGIIFYRHDYLHGLTTAAGVWATAGIGLAIGAGMLYIGLFATFALVLLQIVLHKPLGFLREKTVSIIKITAVILGPDTIDTIKYVFSAQKFLNYRTTSMDDGTIVADIVAVSDVMFTEKELFAINKKYDFIRTVEKSEEL